MRALVYHGPATKAWEDVPDPAIQDPTDAIVRIDTTTICGTDLHILKGDVPAVTDGRILGHEAVGTVTELGSAVTGLSVGDKVIIPAITNCGSCGYCTRGMPAHCQQVGGIGWIFGHLINGLQAEYARVPFAGSSLVKVPAGMSDEQVLFLTDILPTGYEIGVLNGDVKDGDAVAVIGVGPVGLAAVMTARMKGASKIIAVDRDEFRLRARRGRRHRSGWRSRVADHRHERGPARRDDREHRGARSAGGATHPEPVDPQHHPAHRAGQRDDHPRIAQRHSEQRDRAGTVRHAQVQAQRHQ
jgi:threonine dehydrogenase-like Zn-dependent dehydrogenase